MVSYNFRGARAFGIARRPRPLDHDGGHNLGLCSLPEITNLRPGVHGAAVRYRLPRHRGTNKSAPALGRPQRPERLRSCVAAIAGRFSAAECPAILVDADAGRFGAASDLMGLAEKLQAPVAVINTAKSVSGQVRAAEGRMRELEAHVWHHQDRADTTSTKAEQASPTCCERRSTSSTATSRPQPKSCPEGAPDEFRQLSWQRSGSRRQSRQRFLKRVGDSSV